MKAPNIKEMLTAGVHFGHQTLRWNPKMKKFILAEKNGIHIIDLSKTEKCLEKAIQGIQRTVSSRKKILFVGTKKSVRHCIKEHAERSNSFYVTERWLGGMLTNFSTVRKSIAKLDKIEKDEADGVHKELKKKQVLAINKQRQKLEDVLGGIRKMTNLPGLLFIVDIKHEHIAVREAKRLNIPIAAIVDTNTNPDDIDFPIPGNDDAIKSVNLILNYIAENVIEQSEQFKDADEAPATQSSAPDAKAEEEEEAVAVAGKQGKEG